MALNPFVYPKTRHRRRQEPPPYRSYRPYKPFLKREFSSQCVYCRLPDGLKGDDTFGVDHYRPQSKFPDLLTTYSNLFYACNACNRRKGDFWPTDVQRRAGEFIPNPCDHVMFEHIRYNSTRVESKSSAGVLAAEVLMLNDEESVKQRALVLYIITTLEANKRQLEESLRRINQLISSQPKEMALLAEKRAEVEQDLATLDSHLAKITVASTEPDHTP